MLHQYRAHKTIRRVPVGENANYFRTTFQFFVQISLGGRESPSRFLWIHFYTDQSPEHHVCRIGWWHRRSSRPWRSPDFLSYFEVGRIQRHKRVVLGKSPISKRFYFLFQLFTKAGYCRFRYTGTAKCSTTLYTLRVDTPFTTISAMAANRTPSLWL